MKKKLIAAGAASLAVAAMPVVGVFATTGVYGDVVGSSNHVIDTVQLTVLKTCQMEVANSYAIMTTGENPTATGDYGGTYNLGTSTVAHVFDGTVPGDNAGATHDDGGIAGTPMTLTCNGEGPASGQTDAGIGWSLSATTTSLSRAMTGGGEDPYAISFGAYPSSIGAATNSVWSAKLNLSLATGSHTTINTDTAITSGWDNWNSTTSGDTTILKGVSGRSVEGLIVTPAYKAYGAASQPTGTYTGTITYTFHDLTD